MPGAPTSRRDILRLAGLGALALGPASRAAAQGRPRLRLWSNHPEWKDALRRNLDAFEQSTGIAIVLEPKPGPEYVQILSTTMQAGEGPDLPGIPPGLLLQQFHKSGYLADLTGKVRVERLLDTVRQRVVRDGRVLGAPFGKYTVGLYYHAELLARHGVAAPRTWDELKGVCQALKRAGVTPLMMPARDGVIPAFYYMCAASSVMGPAGFSALLAGQRKLTDPDLVAAAQLLVDLAPYYPEGFAAISYAEGKATFARGGTAMILGGTADYAGYVAVNRDVKLDFIAFPPPSASTGVPATVSGLELVYTVNAKSREPEAAARFVDWLTTPESNRLFASSITLPTVTGVVPGGNPIWAKQVQEARHDVPTWRDVDATAPVWTALTRNMQAVLLRQLEPAELGRRAQAALAGG
jgi:ABC-type glycerol-3-phosphate transport system substrate-binding protein